MAVSFCGGSRLPFARPGNSPDPSRAARRRHSGRGRHFLQPYKGPEAVAVSFYGCSRLPFARPGNSPNPPAQLATADLSCSSNKAVASRPLRPRQTFPAAFKALRPWQSICMEVQGCRLPGLETPNPPVQLAGATQSGHGRPFLQLQQGHEAVASLQLLGHSGRGKLFLQITRPWGRGSVLLWKFKAPVCQAWKLPKPFPAARRRHSGRGRFFLQP